MNTALIAKMAAQGGLVTRRDALDSGLTPSRLEGLLRSGELVAIRRGVYADARSWEQLDPFRGRPRLEARAAALMMNRGWVLSHDSAALEWGLPLMPGVPKHVHITRPGYTSAWTRYGVKHHYAHYQSGQVQHVEGMPVLDLARTVVDIGREHGEAACVIAADAALRRGVSRADLIEAYLPMSYWPHVTGVRSGVAFADGRAENPSESLGRMLVNELGLGTPDPQFPIRIGDQIVWADLRVGNHIFEIDGRIKYRDVESGGVSRRPIEDVLWDEKKRERLIAAEGLGISRIIWDDFWDPQRTVARIRLRKEWEVSAARFGAELSPYLARTAAEIRGRLGWRDRIREAGA